MRKKDQRTKKDHQAISIEQKLLKVQLFLRNNQKNRKMEKEEKRKLQETKWLIY